MKKEGVFAFIFVALIVASSIYSISAESIVANSMMEFNVSPVVQNTSYSIWNLNNVFAIAAAILLILAAIFLIKRKKKGKKSKKKKL